MLGTARFALLLLAALPSVCCAAADQPESVLAQAEKLSSLTGPEAQPFHLKLDVAEPANPKSGYTAVIEEYWNSANEWVRTISSPDFQQQIVVKDGQRTEQTSGGYYPLWLSNFVTAAIDPFKNESFWENVSAQALPSGTMNGHPVSSCARSQFKIGTEAVNNDAFAVICFNNDGTLSSLVRPGYSMEFHDARNFGKKRIAYKYVDNPEPGTELVGNVEILEKVKAPAALPVLQTATLPDSGAIESYPVSQAEFERLLPAPLNIQWPAVQSGNTTGKLSMYISADREGRIREAYPLDSDHAGLQDSLRGQLLKVQLKPAEYKGKKIQVEAALTFQFATKLDGSPDSASAGAPAVQPQTSTAEPITISPAIEHALRRKGDLPVYPAGLEGKRTGGIVLLKAIIGREGRIVSLTPIQSTNPEFAKAAMDAVQKWTYQPYLLNGSPVEVQAVITVTFTAY